MKFRLPFLIAFAVFSTAARAQPPATDEPAPLPNAAQLGELIKALDVPGAAMIGLTSCNVDDETVTAGYANLETGAPVTEATAFEAASLTKPVFAYLVMDLVEQGVIDLDAPLAEKFDYARIPDKDAYAKLTPRMVLSHRTGLPNWVAEEIDFYDRKAPIAFEAPPGEAFSYSGEAYQLLQAYVEQVSGEPLEALFKKRLGDVMPNSALALPLPNTVEPSRGYKLASEPETGRDMENLASRAMAAGSLVTTAKDYARFLSHVCRKEGLRPETYAAMLEPQSPAPAGDDSISGTWALGWMTAEIPDGLFIGHSGNNDEYRALAGYIRDSGHGLVILTNGARGKEMIDLMIAPPQ